MELSAYGLVIVGQPELDVAWHNLPEVTNTQREYLEYGNFDSVVWNWAIMHKELLGDMKLEHVMAANWSQGIVGFVVGNSDNRRFKKNKNLTMEIARASSLYQTLFQQRANVYVASVTSIGREDVEE